MHNNLLSAILGASCLVAAPLFAVEKKTSPKLAIPIQNTGKSPVGGFAPIAAFGTFKDQGTDKKSTDKKQQAPTPKTEIIDPNFDCTGLMAAIKKEAKELYAKELQETIADLKWVVEQLKTKELKEEAENLNPFLTALRRDHTLTTKEYLNIKTAPAITLCKKIIETKQENRIKLKKVADLTWVVEKLKTEELKEKKTLYSFLTTLREKCILTEEEYLAVVKEFENTAPAITLCQKIIETKQENAESEKKNPSSGHQLGHYLAQVAKILNVKIPERLLESYKNNHVGFFTEYRKLCFNKLSLDRVDEFINSDDQPIFVKTVFNDQFNMGKI